MLIRRLVMTLIFCGFLGGSAANAADPQCYNLASLQGQYAVVLNYGANVAMGLGTKYYDGKGNFANTNLINQPTAGSTTGARTIVTTTNVGTYTVNCDGTGVIIRNLTAPDGTVTHTTDDFVITGAIVVPSPLGQYVSDQLIATAIQVAVRTPSAIVSGGIFVTRSETLLPFRHAPQP